MIARRLRASDVARAGNVSRAAVSKWFATQEKTGRVNIESTTLLNLSAGLRIKPAWLLEKAEDLTSYHHKYLWDRLYPDMSSFLSALARRSPVAVARLVQVAGFEDARRVVGRGALVLFEKVKRHIKPARRKQLEVLCPLYLPRTKNRKTRSQGERSPVRS